MNPRETNIKDIQDIVELNRSNYIKNIWTDNAFYPRKLTRLQKKLDDLRREEAIIKVRLLNNIELDKNYQNTPDKKMTQEPIQSFRFMSSTLPPNQAIPHDVGQLLLNPSINEQYGKLQGISDDIKKTLSEIEMTKKLYKKSLEKVEELKKKKTPGSVPVTDSDMAMQDLTKTRVYYTQLLYQLALKYNSMTTQQIGDFSSVETTPTRIFPSDMMSVQKLMSLREIFRAIAKSKGMEDLLVTDKYTDGDGLILDDPGSDKNIARLNVELNELWEVGLNDITEEKVKTYINSLETSINDPRHSRDVKRSPPQNFGDSVHDTSKTYPTSRVASVNFLGKNVFFDIPITSKWIDGALAAHKDKNRKMCLGLPPCPDAVPKLDPEQKAATENDTQEAIINDQASKKLEIKKAEAGQKIVVPYDTTKKIGILNEEQTATFYELCRLIGCSPKSLYYLIHFESSWNTQAKNMEVDEYGKLITGARGLIQYIGTTATMMGYPSKDYVSTEYPEISDHLMGPVLRYFQVWMNEYKIKKLDSDELLFMMVFQPGSIPKLKASLDGDFGLSKKDAKANFNLTTPRLYINKVYAVANQDGLTALKIPEAIPNTVTTTSGESTKKGAGGTI
jgi:hypothetical protein